jgi:hypothetical protein
LYTESDSKIGRWQGGAADVEAAQPERLSAGVPEDGLVFGVGCRRLSNLVATRRSQNRFLNHEWYILAHK